MAITTLCSPTVPTIPPLSSSSSSSMKPQFFLQPSLTTLSSSSSSSSSYMSKLGLILVSENPVVISLAAPELVTTAASIDSLRASVWSIREVSCGNECNNGVGRRREKRRRRRKGTMNMAENVDDDGDEEVMVMDAKCMLLSAREEGEHALRIKEMANLEATRRRVTTADEAERNSNQWAKAVGLNQRSLDRKLCKGRESRERICRIYKRLVVSVANGYQGKGLSMQDLIQEGSIGLLRGVEKFDPTRGYKLSTYVYYWIRQAITRAIANKSRLVRLPGRMCEMLAKVAETNKVLNKKLGRVPSFDEIAEELDVKVSIVRLVSERSRPPISLNGIATARGCLTLQEIIAGPDETMPETMVRKQQKKQYMEKIIRTVLNEREANVLRLYFGLDGETPRSCEEVGRLLKLSRERVRQINGIALSKLRQTTIIENLEMYML